MPTYAPPQLQQSQPGPHQPGANTAPDKRKRSASWLKTLHQWHWISSAICLFGMLLFAITGITLNHSGAIEAKPSTDSRIATLSPALLDELKTRQLDGEAPLPASLRSWLQRELRLRIGSDQAEWSQDEIYLPLPKPGGDAWLRLDLASGEVEYELTDRGWVAWANDLHKGRNTGTAWSWFIDVFAVACVVFSITGLLILQVHAANRPAVWPTVGLGVLIPVLIALLFIH
ncbi:MAG TPA: PepSY-associated TM helix domain-containing protein [Rhodocyclaceae bacterium]|nr:PepSY-associated TM helix domain-containing protein [Rhodocyclaceae bacterium]